MRRGRSAQLGAVLVDAPRSGAQRPCCVASCLPRYATGEEEFRLYNEGDQLYAAMLESIAHARSSVRLESYIFADDEVGWRFAEALAARARAGVSVRVHLDAAGSMFWSANQAARYMRGSRARLRWFHRWSWRHPLRYNRRNHRKLLVVDEREVYLGGFNIHRESSREFCGEQRWRDTHVRVRGSATGREAARLFDEFWRGQRRWYPHRTRPGSVLLPNHVAGCGHMLRCVYTQMLAGTREHIRLTTPYFVPDRPTQRALMQAARRGVAVHLMVPRKTDVKITRWAARAAYAGLLAAGVHIHEYLPRMLHAKTAVADGAWAIVGTANLDYRSFFVNYEIMLATREHQVVDELERQFQADLAQCETVQPARWPQRRWPARARELAGWAARRWL